MAETVLIVEDDDVVRRFTVEALRASGCQVLEAHDAVYTAIKKQSES